MDDHDVGPLDLRHLLVEHRGIKPDIRLCKPNKIHEYLSYKSQSTPWPRSHYIDTPLSKTLSTSNPAESPL